MSNGEILNVGFQVQLGSHRCTVEQVLGDGNQGEVARVSVEGQTFALKWYKPEKARPDQYDNLCRLARRGPPDATKFLWPLVVGPAPGLPAFGYLMPFREARFREANDYLLGQFAVKPRQLAAACAQVAQCLYLVHQKGMCYCDISPGNVAFDPATGEVRIFDNDNVKVDARDAAHHTPGTDGFMAPEIVRGESNPTKESDRFGLAVLLFWLLAHRHPFEGSILDTIPGWDDTKDMQIYGKPAPFICHETDASNRTFGPDSDPGVQRGVERALKRWAGLPRFLRARFINAFVHTVNQPKSRDTTLNWRDDLLALHDAALACPACKGETYYDGHTPGATDIGPCPHCTKPIPLPPRLAITRQNQRRVIPVTEATKLYTAHIGEEEHWDLTTPLASVDPHPTIPGVYGLKNLGKKSWTGTNVDGKFFDVEPGKRVVIKHQMKVNFGAVKGEFRI